MRPSMDRASGERRWQPVNNAADWNRDTRQTVFDAVRACISHAMHASLRTDASPQEIYASDAVFRELHDCARAYAKMLNAIGQSADEAAALIVAAAREAAQPGALHPSIVSALLQWCEEKTSREAGGTV